MMITTSLHPNLTNSQKHIFFAGTGWALHGPVHITEYHSNSEKRPDSLLFITMLGARRADRQRGNVA